MKIVAEPNRGIQSQSCSHAEVNREYGRFPSLDLQISFVLIL